MSKQEQTVLFDALGPRGKQNVLVASLISGVVLLALLGGAAYVLAGKDFFSPASWSTVFDAILIQEVWLPAILGTLKAAALGCVGALILGVIIGMGRVSTIKPIRWFTSGYVQFFRAMPLLLLIWIPYTVNLYTHTVNPLFGGNTTTISLFFVVLGLSVYNGAILAEILRSGINSLPPGQAMAGSAVGLRRGQVMRIIVLPQALRNMLPAVLAQLVILLKDTSLAYLVTYPELLHEATGMARNFSSSFLQILITAALIYFVLAYSLSKLATYVERKTRRKVPSDAAVVSKTMSQPAEATP